MKLKPVYIKTSVPVDISALPSASSHLWGMPDLPANVALPHCRQTFIGQFNLGNLKGDGYDSKSHGLPSSGLLSVFADIGHFFCPDIDSEICMSYSDACTVIYTPECDFPKLRRRNLRRFAPLAQTVTFSPEPLPLSEPEHVLSGFPTHREWSDWDYPYNGWRLLFQLDSCDVYPGSLNFYDCGVLNFIISPAALRRLDFSNVKAIVLST